MKTIEISRPQQLTDHAMIRIHLQPRRRRLVPYLLLGLGAFALSAMGFIYLAGEQRGAVPVELAAREEAPATESPMVAERKPQLPMVAERKPEPALEAGANLEPAPSPSEPVPAEVPAQREPAKAVTRAPAQPPPTPGKGQAPVLAGSGPLCLRILQLHERLPAAVRCTSLSGTAGGDYTIEGTVPGGDFPQLIALLDALQRLPARATLSSWRAGQKEEGDHNFNLHGQFPASGPPAQAPMETTQAAGLFTQAAALARKARLDSVRVGAPLYTPVGKGVVQQRQKLWATGSYPQLKSFVETLVRQQPQLRLEEVMLVPHYKGEAQWKQAQFYAVLSTAVRAAR